MGGKFETWRNCQGRTGETTSREWEIPNLGQLMRGRAVAARQAHNLKVAGSNPAPATFIAGVAELADAPRSGRGARKGVWVQLPSSAPGEGTIPEAAISSLAALVSSATLIRSITPEEPQ